ncbi:putative metal-dependent hydrolase YfiT [compost metagenome]
MDSLEELKYPIGKFSFPLMITPALIAGWIDQLESFPEALAQVLHPLTPAQLDTCYRPGGWSVRQVVHHLADSHLNAYTRVKLILTEDNPMVKPYEEALWAELPDAKQGDVQSSVDILKGTHSRMAAALRVLDYVDFERPYRHPEFTTGLSLAFLTGNYVWHGKHHLAQILSTLPDERPMA